MNDNNFEIILDKIIYQPVQNIVCLKNNLNKLNSYLEYSGNSLKIINYSKDPDAVFLLGGSICNQIFNWNRYFNDASYLRAVRKYRQAEIDEDLDFKIINFSDNYFDNFSAKFQLKNQILNGNVTDKKVIRTDLGDPNNLIPIVDEFNNKFNTDFIVNKIELIDQLYFANIRFQNANLIDVFCLGFDLQLFEEKMNQKSK